MVICELYDKYYIPKNNYQKVRNNLLDFSNKVDKAVGKENRTKRIPKEVLVYANAVKKSTTNKDRRITRHKIILKVISRYLKRNPF